MFLSCLMFVLLVALDRFLIMYVSFVVAFENPESPPHLEKGCCLGVSVSFVYLRHLIL